VRARVALLVVIHGLIAVFCGLLPASAWAQKLYKHVDEKGVVTYSDRPDTVNDKKLTVSNTARVGDRTDAINENLQTHTTESERVQRAKQAEAARRFRMREMGLDPDVDADPNESPQKSRAKPVK
jgi:hypothetical protein